MLAGGTQRTVTLLFLEPGVWRRRSTHPHGHRDHPTTRFVRRHPFTPTHSPLRKTGPPPSLNAGGTHQGGAGRPCTIILRGIHLISRIPIARDRTLTPVRLSDKRPGSPLTLPPATTALVHCPDQLVSPPVSQTATNRHDLPRHIHDHCRDMARLLAPVSRLNDVNQEGGTCLAMHCPCSMLLRRVPRR